MPVPSSLQIEPFLNGALALGPRPRLKRLADYQRQGVTHIWTLLAEHEGAREIERATLKAGLQWLWLPLANGKPPEAALLPTINACFSQCLDDLEKGAVIYLHCSAGIHRTGMVIYAFFRYAGLSRDEALVHLKNMREVTHEGAFEGAGEQRLAWADQVFG